MNRAVIHHTPGDSPLVFKATYADFKNIKTRKILQIILEVPIEGADAALKALGGVPRSDCETWVAVARLDPALDAREMSASPASEPRNAPAEASAPKERQRFATMPLPKQAAIRCGDPDFRRFLAQRGHFARSGIAVLDLDMAAGEVREICCVTSRSQISDADGSGDLWTALDREYGDWKHAASLDGIEVR